MQKPPTKKPRVKAPKKKKEKILRVPIGVRPSKAYVRAIEDRDGVIGS